MSGAASCLTVGIVGAGEISRKAHVPVLVNIPEVKIAWIYDLRVRAAQAIARAYGIPTVEAIAPDALPRCDVILLAIPVDARGGYLEHARATGAAVLCEKPIALTSVAHRELIRRFCPHELGAGFMRRFFRSTMLLRQVVAEGLFGRLLGIEISEGNRSKGSGVDESFLDDPRLGASRGVLVDLGSHSIDLALHICGATEFKVSSCTVVSDGGVDRKVTATVQLRTALPTSAPIELRYVVSWLDRQANHIRLTFEHTSVWSALVPHAEVFVGNPERPGTALRLTQQTPGATTYNQAFYLEWREFLAGFQAQRESLASARSALLTTELVESLLSIGSAANA